MNYKLKEKEKIVTKNIIELISVGDITNEIIGESPSPPDDFKRAISDFELAVDKKITTPRADAYENIGYVEEFLDNNPPIIFVGFNLWFDGEASDLEAQIIIEINEEGEPYARLHDILVP